MDTCIHDLMCLTATFSDELFRFHKTKVEVSSSAAQQGWKRLKSEMQPCSYVTAGGRHPGCLNTESGNRGLGIFEKIWPLWIHLKMVKQEHTSRVVRDCPAVADT